MKEKLVVIGNGMAGARTVEEILARGGGERFEITMIGDEPYGNYNRILLSNVLNGAQEASEIFLNPLSWYKDNHITLIAGVRATAIDRTAQRITLADGRRVAYDQLMIATGSRPFVPRLEGLYGEAGGMRSGVFVFRTIDDCTKIAGTAAKARKAAVVGGGLLGLEAARGLLRFGCEVHVIHLSSHLMENQLDPTASRMLKKTMQKMGVHVHLEKGTTAILGNSEVTGLAFKDGSTLDCDMVVISCGITPNTELARECGLSVERGIVVTDGMQSVDDARVWVVGECAEHRGRVYGLVAPLWEQGQVLADRLTEKRPEALYTGSKLATKLKVMGVELASMGVTGAQEDEDEEVVYSEPKTGIYKKLVIRKGQLIGAILLGDAEKAGYLMQTFDRSSALPDERAMLLFDIGAEPSLGATMIEMPESAQVCNCNGVSKGAILKCVNAGAKSLKMVMEKTRAGTGCGSCKKLVGEVVAWACEGQVEEDPSVHWYVPGIPLSKPELVTAIQARGLRSVSGVFAALAPHGADDPGSKMGLASLLKSLWGAEYEDERDARFINDRVHANIQKDRTFSVIPRIYGGITTADDLIKIGEVAKKYAVPMVKFTGGQRIDLLGIKKDDLPGVWQDLGMPSGHAYAKAFRTCKTCVGTDFCRYGLGDSTALGIRIEKRYQGLESPGKLKMATAGCPRNCSEAYVKDVGLVAIGDDRWEIYVGGAAGAHVRKGDLLATVTGHDDALRLVDRFLMYYIQNAKYLERTYGFVERVGLEKLRTVLVADAEGIGERLDAAMEQQRAAYVDPWLEAAQNKTANQFRTELPVVHA